MVSLASELADGVILYLRPLDELRETVQKLRRNTNDSQFEVACSIICAVSDSEPELARIRAAQTLAFNVAVGKYYRAFLSESGFSSEASAILEAYSHGGAEAAGKCVSERMLQSLTICGTREECSKALSRFEAAGITLPIIQFNPVGRTESSFRELLSTF